MIYRQKKASKDPSNLELTAIRPGMTFEEVERNLVAALQRSGIRVDGYDPDGKPSQQAESRDLIEKLMTEDGLTEEQAVRAISDALL